MLYLINDLRMLLFASAQQLALCLIDNLVDSNCGETSACCRGVDLSLADMYQESII